MTILAAFTYAQERQQLILAAKGYRLTILHRDEDKQQIGVAGRDPSNARILGAIDARGVFTADLIDFAPSTVTVCAPPAEPTVEEVMA